MDNYGGPGPPYALLQGSLGTPYFKNLEKEGAPAAGRGFACLIGTGPDFFLAVSRRERRHALMHMRRALLPASCSTPCRMWVASLSLACRPHAPHLAGSAAPSPSRLGHSC